jgi:hypothetical protein
MYTDLYYTFEVWIHREYSSKYGIVSTQQASRLKVEKIVDIPCVISTISIQLCTNSYHS